MIQAQFQEPELPTVNQKFVPRGSTNSVAGMTDCTSLVQQAASRCLAQAYEPVHGPTWKMGAKIRRVGRAGIEFWKNQLRETGFNYNQFFITVYEEHHRIAEGISSLAKEAKAVAKKAKKAGIPVSTPVFVGDDENPSSRTLIIVDGAHRLMALRELREEALSQPGADPDAIEKKFKVKIWVVDRADEQYWVVLAKSMNDLSEVYHKEVTRSSHLAPNENLLFVVRSGLTRHFRILSKVGWSLGQTGISRKTSGPCQSAKRVERHGQKRSVCLFECVCSSVS